MLKIRTWWPPFTGTAVTLWLITSETVRLLVLRIAFIFHFLCTMLYVHSLLGLLTSTVLLNLPCLQIISM